MRKIRFSDVILDLQETTTQRAHTLTCIELHLTNPGRSVANITCQFLTRHRPVSNLLCSHQYAIGHGTDK